MTTNLQAIRVSEHFKLGSHPISHFLTSPEQKSGVAKIQEVFQLCINRLIHFFQTGIWIDENKCLRYCHQHNISDAALIEGLFNRCVAQQFPRFEEEMRKPSFAESVKEKLCFIQRFLQNPNTVGSIFPSSSLLAKEITRLIQSEPNGAPCRYLEIGAGEGVFSEKIAEKLRACDRFDIVEYDPQLAALLRAKFAHLPNVTVHEISILDYTAEQYDAVVSGLPLSSLGPEFAEAALNKYVQLAKPGANLSYFELIGVKSLARVLQHLPFSPAFHQRQMAVASLKDRFVEQYGQSSVDVLINLPPARVHHCRI